MTGEPITTTADHIGVKQGQRQPSRARPQRPATEKTGTARAKSHRERKMASWAAHGVGFALAITIVSQILFGGQCAGLW